MSDRPRVLFIGGLGRSGSTLLELILSQSPDVCAVGEVVHMWHRALVGNERCGCGERFADCAFWQQVGDKAFGGWSNLDADEVLALKAAVDRTRFVIRLSRPRPPEQFLAQVRRYADLYTRVYRAALDASGASVIIDSSKHASLAFVLSWAEDLDLRVTHMIRDSRAVAHSWSKEVRRPEVVDQEVYMPRFSPARVAALWTAQSTAFELLGRRVPVRPLRYEDFTADPQGTVRQLRSYAGLPEDPRALDILSDPDFSPRGSHQVAGNPLRFSAGPVRVRRDDAWRTAFPRRGRLVVGTMTLPLRAKYGYLRSGNSAPAQAPAPQEANQ